MSTIFECPQCAKKLKMSARGQHASTSRKKVRCPGCQTVFEVALPQENSPPPVQAASPAADEWMVASHDGQQYGPVGKAELDGWVQEGLVSAECRIRRAADSQWQAAAAIYPQLTGPPAGQGIPASAPAQPSGNTRWRITHTVGMIFTGMGLKNWQFLCGPDGIVVVPVSLMETVKLGAAAGTGAASPHAGVRGVNKVIDNNLGEDREFELEDHGDAEWERFPREQLSSMVVTKRGFNGCKIELVRAGQPSDVYKIDYIEGTQRARIVLRAVFPQLYKEVKFRKPP